MAVWTWIIDLLSPSDRFERWFHCRAIDCSSMKPIWRNERFSSRVVRRTSSIQLDGRRSDFMFAKHRCGDFLPSSFTSPTWQWSRHCRPDLRKQWIDLRLKCEDTLSRWPLPFLFLCWSSTVVFCVIDVFESNRPSMRTSIEIERNTKSYRRRTPRTRISFFPINLAACLLLDESWTDEEICQSICTCRLLFDDQSSVSDLFRRTSSVECCSTRLRTRYLRHQRWTGVLSEFVRHSESVDLQHETETSQCAQCLVLHGEQSNEHHCTRSVDWLHAFTHSTVLSRARQRVSVRCEFIGQRQWRTEVVRDVVIGSIGDSRELSVGEVWRWIVHLVSNDQCGNQTASDDHWCSLHWCAVLSRDDGHIVYRLWSGDGTDRRQSPSANPFASRSVLSNCLRSIVLLRVDEDLSVRSRHESRLDFDGE